MRNKRTYLMRSQIHEGINIFSSFPSVTGHVGFISCMYHIDMTTQFSSVFKTFIANVSKGVLFIRAHIFLSEQLNRHNFVQDKSVG